MIRSRIIGTGFFVPSKVLTNNELEEMVDTSDKWIRERTGIRERRIAEEQNSSDLATKASANALKMAGIKASDIDLIIVATVTPDMVFPSTACFLQKKIGAASASAFDISAACSGFIYAMDVADKYIKGGSAKKVLVVGVDRFSSIIDWQDRATCILFGDGAGAVVLTSEEGKRGLLSSHIFSNGNFWDMLYAPLNGSSNGLTASSAASAQKGGVKMRGNETFKIAVKMMEEASLEALRCNHLGVADLDLFIPHQANARIINSAAQRLSLPQEKIYMNIDKYGNTSAASIPIAMAEAHKAGLIHDNSLILLVAFGGGFTWASSLIRW